MPYTNADGLRWYFAGESRSVQGGEYPGAGSVRVIEVEFDGLGLSTTAGTPTLIGKPWIIVPRNSVITQVDVVAETVFTGGTSINVGLQRMNGTELDHDGLVAALPIANLNVTGEKTALNAGVTFAGALVGTETLYPGYIDVYATGTFTAGHGLIRIQLYVADEDVNVNNW